MSVPPYPKLNFAPVPKKVPTIYERRLELFASETEYPDRNLLSVINSDHVHDNHVRLEVYSVPDLRRPPFSIGSKGPFREASVGQSFGPSWSTHWFKVHVKIPEYWPGDSRVLFEWNLGNEGLIYREDGMIEVGLSGQERREWCIPREWKDAQWHTFFIEASCNFMLGNGDPSHMIMPPNKDRYFDLKTADLVLPNEEARSLRLDFSTISQAAMKLPENSWQRHKALEVASAIMDTFDDTDLSTLKKCRDIARQFLGEKVDSVEVYKTTGTQGTVFAVGHCHIDTAWLWPYAETRRKIARSWASQMNLMERYPEYSFVCPQAIQYQWLKEDYPQLFQRLKQHVKTGRFVPTGGAWVESDTNIPSGEAIARQFLYGQRFFESNFGNRSGTFWLPDTFGYTAQIPQLCRLAGMENFITQKLSWNNVNKFPNTTFNWIALDGTQVICHTPRDTCNSADRIVEEINYTETQHNNAGIDQSGIVLFGYGDGGGGPTYEMLETLRRTKGIADTVGFIPHVRMGAKVEDFFENVKKTTAGGSKLVSWVGDLYLELHRAAYTTQASVKRNNRLSEVVLHDLEYLSTALSVSDANIKYPKEEIDELWKLVLLNQFHDVLPGTSIEIVYDDVDKIYQNVFKQAKALSDKLLAAAGCNSNYLETADVVAVNTLPWGRSEVVKLPNPAKYGIHSQSTSEGHLVRFNSMNSGFMKPITITEDEASASVSATEVSAGAFVLQNDAIRATIVDGALISYVDLAEDREIIVPGSGGVKFVLFDDQPLVWQAWDTEMYSLNQRKVLGSGKVSIIENGPLRAAVLIEQQISANSWIKTTVSLDAYTKPSNRSVADVSFIEFNSEVEWRENSKFLKVEFPVDIQCEYASYDTMFGVVRRPTNYNTSWDMAKFEVCCHKFADLSDFSYGVSVLNDSKYGFATHGNVMRLSLLKAAKAPDANADMGRHHIRYALLGHAERLSSDVVRASYNFNHPLKITSVSPQSSLSELEIVNFDGPKNIILSTVKRAEDDVDISTGELPAKRVTKSIVVRLYDSLGGKSKGYITTSLPLQKVVACNLLEDDLAEVEFETMRTGGARIPVNIRAFEIASFRLELS